MNGGEPGPRIFATAKQAELARQRAREDRFASAIRSLRAQRDELAASEMPVFEKDWWEEARSKRWQDIYPEINRHTMFAVVDAPVRAAACALLHLATGDRKALDQTLRVLRHYSSYEFFAEHPDVGLNWSVWLMRLLKAADFCGHALSEEECKRLDLFFARACAAVMQNDRWWLEHNPGGLYNNHFAWHKLFLGAYGLFYGRAELVEYALSSDQGVLELIEQGCRDDGLWLESSLNYHFTALAPLVELARLLRNAGHPVDLWSARLANGRALADLARGPLQALWPDRTLPTLGDCYGRRLNLTGLDLYFAVYDALPDPGIAWLLKDRRELPPDCLLLEHLPEPSAARAPQMRTRLWPEHGYVALRPARDDCYWSGEGFSAFLTFDRDGIHSHRDKLSLTVFGRGKHLAVDPEALASEQHAFSSRVQTELNRSTLCHNTVMVDGRDHGSVPERLELLEFVDNSSVSMATVADRGGLVYPGVSLMRTVAVTGAFVLDLFQVACDREREIAYLFHSASDTGEFQAPGDARPVEFEREGPWRWLRDGRRLLTDGAWSVQAEQGDVRIRLSAAPEPGTEVIVCRFPARDDFGGVSWPMLAVRRRAGCTVFALLIQAERERLPEARLDLSDGRHGTLRARVTLQGHPAKLEFSVRRLAPPG